MMKMWFVLCAMLFSSTSINYPQPAGNSNPPACPSVSGTWVLGDGTEQSNLTMKISQTGCRISGRFIGRESSLRLTGQWSESEKDYQYEGEYLTFSNKCGSGANGEVCR